MCLFDWVCTNVVRSPAPAEQYDLYIYCYILLCRAIYSIQTAAAKIILGCLRPTSHEIILKDLGLTPLFIRRQFHILKAFRAILFGPCSSFLSTLAPKFFKNLSYYSSRFHTNVQLPSCKTHSLHNSFCHKGSKLWNSLPTCLHNFSSRQFCSKVSDLFLTNKTNAWHLHGCNTNATAILCMLRLGHSKLNIDGRYLQLKHCLCTLLQ